MNGCTVERRDGRDASEVFVELRIERLPLRAKIMLETVADHRATSKRTAKLEIPVRGERARRAILSIVTTRQRL